MSNKRIKKRLDQIFDDLKQVDDQAPEHTGKRVSSIKRRTLEGPAVKPANIASLPKEIKSPQSIGTRPLGPIPQSFASAEANESTNILTVPFRSDDGKWSQIEVYPPTQERVWSQEEQQLVKQVTDQLSLALENARLFQQTQNLATELQILNEMGRELSSQLDLPNVLESVYKHTSRLMETHTFIITLITPEYQQVSFPFVILEGQREVFPDRPLGNYLLDYAIQTRSPILIPEKASLAAKDLDLELTQLKNENAPECWLGVPLLLGEKILGTIVLQSLRPGTYSEHHLELLFSIANQAATSIQNVQLFDETQKHGTEVEILNEMAHAMARTLSRDEITENTYGYATRLLDTSSFFIALYDPEEDLVSFPIIFEQGVRVNMPPENRGMD